MCHQFFAYNDIAVGINNIYELFWPKYCLRFSLHRQDCFDFSFDNECFELTRKLSKKIYVF